MQLLFELSKEHPTLPIAEVKACLNVYEVAYREIHHNGIYVIEAKRGNWQEIGKRLAMSFSINEILGENIEEFLQNLEIKGSFKVEGGKLALRKKIGEIVANKKRAKVDLENPDAIIKIFGKYFCKEICKIDRSRYEQRRPMYRPFSLPTTLHPRIARVLVNLAEIKSNDTLIDPFCGTGGILIEAGLIGAKIIGIDVKKELIEGCKKNLEYYGIKNYRLLHADMRKIDLKGDVVVTDFPYGRAAHLSDEMEKLYCKAFEKMAEWLKKGRKAVIGLPSMKFNNEIEKYFEIEQIHPARVHKSLTRFFYVLKKF